MSDDVYHEVVGVRRWYNETANSFSTRYSGTAGEFWRRFEESLALEFLGGPANRILDLGCGPGRLADSLSPLASVVLGVDIAEAMISVACARSHPENVRYSVMDATRTALKSECFDAVISLGMFEYLSDPSPFLSEILRILKPGGRVVFTCYNRVPLVVRAWLFGEAVFRSVMCKSSPKREGPARHELYRTVAHESKQILRVLKNRGFSESDCRGFHFPLTVDAFRISARIPAHVLASAGKSAAVAVDRWLGRSRLTRSMCPLTMFSACKPS